MKILFSVALLLLIGCAQKTPVADGRVDQDLKKYDETIAKMKASFTEPANPDDVAWVKAKIKSMHDMDQYMRSQMQVPFLNKYSAEDKKRFDAEFMPRFEALDREHTAVMKALLKKHDWFTITKFGADTDREAWLLVQHADWDLDFQKEILVRLGKHVKKNETSPKNYAYLYDRVATAPYYPTRRLEQRYGTQGACVGPGKWEPSEIEDPANVDKRRAQMKLGTMEEYKKMFKDKCH